MLAAVSHTAPGSIVLWGLAGLFLGLLAGSFGATLLIRWPEGRTMGGRSRCDACGTPIRAADLVPVFSGLWLRGRCRACEAQIDPSHLRVELASGAVVASALIADPGPAGLLLGFGGWLLLMLALLDLKCLWLPDRLTSALAMTGLAHGWVTTPESLDDRLIGVAIGFLALEAIRRCYLALRGRHGMGAGDPKLAGAIGAWLGWSGLPALVLLASLGGLAWVAIRKIRGMDVATELPFGTMLSASAWLLILAAAAR